MKSVTRVFLSSVKWGNTERPHSAKHHLISPVIMPKPFSFGAKALLQITLGEWGGEVYIYRALCQTLA